jgi:hypothetical protein
VGIDDASFNPSLLCSQSLSSIASSYLTRRHKLQWTERGAHVGHVGLEVVQGGSDAALNLAGLGPRWRVGRDLVQGLGRHDEERCVDGEVRRAWKFENIDESGEDLGFVVYQSALLPRRS